MTLHVSLPWECWKNGIGGMGDLDSGIARITKDQGGMQQDAMDNQVKPLGICSNDKFGAVTCEYFFSELNNGGLVY
ncbi:hypothetical protein GUJ93_ZPchr0005g15977 [Zizania palustris]|uniref:Uncharacterized protein n=1 Tax=Zizania palustris TaxID=103762 RepID=A0A8J5T4P1_ZIZPA|nr:hypothetical protein GUJ93_ZPchr0005g15977 [Zizania palustris]